MLLFFCSVCIDDVESHPSDIQGENASANCPQCNSVIQTTYNLPEGSNEYQNINHYNQLNGLPLVDLPSSED